MRILIIQTSFIGDVVLATALVEKLHLYFPESKIDFLLRKGNEGLFIGHPFLNNVMAWDKKKHKNENLIKLILSIRKKQYSHVINVQRFVSSGLFTLFSGAKYKIGFDKNPLSFLFNKVAKHCISKPFSANPIHEIERNQLLISYFTDEHPALPRLYPTKEDFQKVEQYSSGKYVCIAPASVWYTKQYPESKWVDLINSIPKEFRIFIMGGQNDSELANSIIRNAKRANIDNLCGSFNYLQSTALMQHAEMNYVNDSAPLHFATAVQAPVTVIFCSTIPAFGFGPLIIDKSRIVEFNKKLSCRPCGLHGKKSCPKGDFACAMGIENDQLLWWLNK